MREAELEAWCRQRAVKEGGYLLKWISPGNKGVPDRILFMPHYSAYIEFKSESGKLDPLQQVWQNRLDELGHNVFVVRTKKEFEDILLEAELACTR
jgi:hypothetical protein